MCHPVLYYRVSNSSYVIVIFDVQGRPAKGPIVLLIKKGQLAKGGNKYKNILENFSLSNEAKSFKCFSLEIVTEFSLYKHAQSKQ